MDILKILEEKKPTLSFEIFPPKRESYLKDADETLDILSQLKPDFISVTFGAGGSFSNNKTIELAKKIKKKYEIEPLVHLTCLSYTKYEIDKFIYELKSNDINNILALRGDINPNIEVKDDFKYASDLIKYIKRKDDFCLAGACYPEGHVEAISKEYDIIHLKEKVDVGAEFLISQLFFNNKFFYSFIDKCRNNRINVPIVAGIMPVINKAQIEKMISLCGASLPVELKKIIDKYGNNKEALLDAGISYALNQVIDLMVNDIEGVHLYTMNNPIVAKKICKSINNVRNFNC